jgi:broad specificity phosphatase PhoE
MRLLLIRHAKSRSLLQSGDEDVLADDLNILTDEGRASSASLGQHLSIFFAEVILFASPVARARETALILSQLLRCDVNFDWRLSERKFGFPPGTTCAQSRIMQESRKSAGGERPLRHSLSHRRRAVPMEKRTPPGSQAIPLRPAFSRGAQAKPPQQILLDPPV